MSSSHCVVKCRHLIVSLYIVILCVSGEAQTPQYDHEYQPPFHHKEYTTVNNTPYGESRVSVSSLVIHIELPGMSETTIEVHSLQCHHLDFHWYSFILR